MADEWEHLCWLQASGSHKGAETLRLPVPGGWLYALDNTALCFVPTPAEEKKPELCRLNDVSGRYCCSKLAGHAGRCLFDLGNTRRNEG